MAAQKNNYFVFEVSGKRFALPVTSVEAVHAIPEIVAVPANRSRVVLGLAYMLGKLVTVIDLGPLANLGTTQQRSEGVVIRRDGQYYAAPITASGGIVRNPGIAARSRSAVPIVSGSFRERGGSIAVIDLAKLIDQYVCS